MQQPQQQQAPRQQQQTRGYPNYQPQNFGYPQQQQMFNYPMQQQQPAPYGYPQQHYNSQPYQSQNPYGYNYANMGPTGPTRGYPQLQNNGYPQMAGQMQQQQMPHGPNCTCGQQGRRSVMPQEQPKPQGFAPEEHQQPLKANQETRGFNGYPVMGPSCGGCGHCNTCVQNVGVDVPWGIPTRNGDPVGQFVDDQGFKNTCSSLVDGGFCGLDPYEYEETYSKGKTRATTEIDDEKPTIVRTRDIDHIPNPGFNKLKKKDEIIYIKRH